MPISRTPAACSASSRASALKKASESSSIGTRRFMDVSPERLVEQANDRFQLQDYYGAIHLLEELDRALALNPNYIEALIHRALVLNELGREEEANAVLRRARKVGSERRGGFHGHVAAKLADQ